MMFKQIILIIAYIVIFASYSFASSISKYKDEVSSYAKSLQSQYDLKKINVKYNIFKIKNNNYAAMYILSDNNVAIAVCSALDDGKLNNCESAFFYSLNYNNAAPADFTFNSNSIFIDFNMDLDKNKKPYTISIKLKNNKFYFNSYTKTADKTEKFYYSQIGRAIYSDISYLSDFTLPLGDISLITLLPRKFEDVVYDVKNFPKAAPYIYSKLFKTSGNIVSVEAYNNHKLSVLAIITSYEPYDTKYNDRNETYTVYICKPDFNDCLEGNLAVHDTSEYIISIWEQDDYITFKALKHIYEDSKDLYHYVTYKLKNGKYYLDKIVEMQEIKTGLLFEHISTIKYDSKGNLTIPFK